MAPTPRRRFNLLDCLVLVAVTAPGLAYVIRLPRHSGRMPDWWEWSARRSIELMPLLALCTLALVVLRLRKPRPTCPRLMRQPGMVAGCTATVSIAVITLGGIVSSVYNSCQLARAGVVPFAQGLKDDFGHVDLFIWWNTLEWASHVGLAVLACWVVQWLGGRWRPEPSWIDRCLRILGVLWIVVQLICVRFTV
ncbi:MAG TPA: hypothetical protein VGZ22_21965 [Isosphaeraceae bacterium]|jgi:hypothetical protein|nr:hypothetical protein [Isosphaeraceae bacterium]